jgi:hypothetical protein
MIDLLLMTLVLGVTMVALTIDVAAVIGWLKKEIKR